MKDIRLVVPLEPGEEIDPDIEPKTMFISPEGADPNREVPGFFIIEVDRKHVLMENPPAGQEWMPRQFLSLDAVHKWLRETYGWKTPLRVISYVRTGPGEARDFPAIWGAERKAGRKRVVVRVRYLGSFNYWDGRRVDPTKVGTRREFN